MAVFDTPAAGLAALLGGGRCCGHAATAAAAVVDALRAGAWALGAPAAAVAAALSLGGGGFWVLPAALPAAVAAAARAELAAIPGRYRHPIFNTTAVAAIRAAGRSGDRRRQQAALAAENLAALGAVPGLRAAVAALDGLGVVLDGLWGGGRRYRPVFPVALVSEPAAAQQLPHADACPMEMVGDPPAVVGGLLAVEDGTRLVAWPAAHGVLLAGGEADPRARRVVGVPTGGALLFRGDAVHCGAANPGRRRHVRLHTCVSLFLFLWSLVAAGGR
ncbi:hypothetical protein I4F81_008479 [Pyropia yezoensis]|uniref:Uncharacterized protein n=1 Tax=Pyropia yezoensis TaxID=2788 RepID=A0ACC3C7B2_PYRYE|nr:hypothetical protein I4F81_008479 [Neopyropia yezoensis]